MVRVVSLSLFSNIVHKYPDFSLFWGLSSHWRYLFNNIYNPGHNVLAIYHVSGEVQDYIFSIRVLGAASQVVK